jgi:hypothetical protein
VALEVRASHATISTVESRTVVAIAYLLQQNSPPASARAVVVVVRCELQQQLLPVCAQLLRQLLQLDPPELDAAAPEAALRGARGSGVETPSGLSLTTRSGECTPGARSDGGPKSRRPHATERRPLQ